MRVGMYLPTPLQKPEAEFSKFEFRVFLPLDWLPYKAKDLSLSYYIAHSHTFPRVLVRSETQTRRVQDLNSSRRVHYTVTLHHGYLCMSACVYERGKERERERAWERERVTKRLRETESERERVTKRLRETESERERERERESQFTCRGKYMSVCR